MAGSGARGWAWGLVEVADSFDPAGIVEVLNWHGIDDVVIGAFAAIAQRAPIPATRDIDFTPSSSPENPDRLAAALKELGEFVLSFSPSAFEGGFEDLITRSHSVSVGGTVVIIADLADVIRSKEAAGRPKDLGVLPALYRRLAEMREAGDP